MTIEEAKRRMEICRDFLANNYSDMGELNFTAFNMAIQALSQDPSREFEDYENEIEDLHNRLDIAEYDKERLREEVTNLEAKIKAQSQEPFADAVSREALKKMLIGLDKWHVKNKQFVNVGLLYDDVFFGIEQLPSVTQKSGKWIDINGIYAECSNCNEEIYITGDFKFCPNCGACMKDGRTLDEFIKEQTECTV